MSDNTSLPKPEGSSPFMVTKLVAKLNELSKLVRVPSAQWNSKIPRMCQLVTSMQHLINDTNTRNAPLDKLATLVHEIAELEKSIAQFPQATIRDCTLHILHSLTTMSGQLFPFLLDVLKYANQPQTQLNATILKLENAVAKQGSKINSINQQLHIFVEKAEKAEERVAKAEKMNAAYDFVHSVKRILCSHLKVNHQNYSITIAQALRSGATDWATVQTILQLEDQSSESLLKTLHKIKDERLEYGHASKATAKDLVLSTSYKTASLWGLRVC
ncbi:hypothetical protein PSHT_00176 [Puccinia striiformis]|uniref:Uncharacterized protein n=1 Tax=Puccinia striiformis TaxID=27350 RepID=A0A2S4WP11_9BASI|nr:hypothetical protein PSHT_00176 [Puccinia striiformis]